MGDKEHSRRTCAFPHCAGRLWITAGNASVSSIVARRSKKMRQVRRKCARCAATGTSTTRPAPNVRFNTICPIRHAPTSAAILAAPTQGRWHHGHHPGPQHGHRPYPLTHPPGTGLLSSTGLTRRHVDRPAGRSTIAGSAPDGGLTATLTLRMTGHCVTCAQPTTTVNVRPGYRAACPLCAPLRFQCEDCCEGHPPPALVGAFVTDRGGPPFRTPPTGNASACVPRW